MKIDLTITLSAILGLSAIISPIIVTLINNHYLLKNKKFERFDEINNKILFDFIDATLDCKTDKIGFYKAYNKVSLYCNIWGNIKPLLLRNIKDLVEEDADIEDINHALYMFVYIANTNKEKIK